jgi:hypothetical protein
MLSSRHAVTDLIDAWDACALATGGSDPEQGGQSDSPHRAVGESRAGSVVFHGIRWRSDLGTPSERIDNPFPDRLSLVIEGVSHQNLLWVGHSSHLLAQRGQISILASRTFRSQASWMPSCSLRARRAGIGTPDVLKNDAMGRALA